MKYFLAIILILVFLGGYLFWWGIYYPKDLSAEESTVFLVKKGSSVQKIAEGLQDEGLIKHKYFFVVYILLSKDSQNLIAGEYELSQNMTVEEIANKIISGDRVKKIITVIEGWTIKDIENRLNIENINPNLEGYLFPDSYEIYPEEGAEEIINRMRANFDSKVGKEIDLEREDLEEIIIMASILEKEVRTFEDKRIVSGILWKRIKSGMPLQVDATINYITRKNSSRLTGSELSLDSPYNTYKYRGLPPGPICNPGIDSIKATVSPIETKYWFYLSTPEGETIFSTTFKEHQEAIEKYLR